MHYNTLVSAVLLISGVSMTAMADDNSRRAAFAQHIFSEADTDGDGELTFYEFQAHINARMTDANRPANAPPVPTEAQLSERFTTMDTDESGTLSLAELQAGLPDRGPPPPPPSSTT